MKRVRVALIGAGTLAEWGILPVLSGPDIFTPPDTGAWWSRRADAANSPDIRYQAPAQPEIVAICDADRARAARLATVFRLRAVYADWRVLLREVEIDAIFCSADSQIAREIALALPTDCRLWLNGTPDFTLHGALETENRTRTNANRIWCARPLRQSAAHRAARRLIERDQIGAPSAISLRWNTPFAALSNINRAAENITDSTNSASASASANAFTASNSTNSYEAKSNTARSNGFAAPETSDRAFGDDSKSDAQNSASQRFANSMASTALRLVESNNLSAQNAAAQNVASQSASAKGFVVNSASKNGFSKEEMARVASSYAALDLLMAFAFVSPENGLSSTRNVANSAQNTSQNDALRNGSVWADGSASNGSASDSGAPSEKATNLMVRFEGGVTGGVTATALFCAADTWSAPLPRLEICGTEGRFLVCEAGRRLWLHQPREAARFWEPPGLSQHVSTANVNGLAEDLKEFLAWCAAPSARQSEILWHNGAALRQAFGALPLFEAAARSRQNGQIVAWNTAFSSTRSTAESAGTSAENAPGIQPTLSFF